MIWFESIFAAVLVAAADQVSKAVVLLHRPASTVSEGRPLISIRCMLNRRGVMAPFVEMRSLLALWAATIGLAALLVAYGKFNGQGVLGSIGVGAAVGGATGNVLDRLRRGAIVDFIAVGPWPVFNLADAAIVMGIGLVLLSLL
jgi:signal peptidase II